MSHSLRTESLPTDDLESDLRCAVRGEVHTDAATRGLYATDASHYQQTPRVVVVPLDEADVLAALQVAHQHRVPTTPRGAATSLSGQTFGPGMVLDLSRHLNRVLQVDAEQGWARVQPGVIRDQLNAQLKPLGLHFAPDPATSSRATIGGMVGNNSSGTRSIVYGKTIDHTLACRVALADGTVINCAATDDPTWQRRAAGEDVQSRREAELYRGVRDVVNHHQQEIRDRYPKVMRRVSGYNLDEFVDDAGYCGPIGPRAEQIAPGAHRIWNLANLIVGSEGTLGVLLEVIVRLTPIPPATAVCVMHFDDELAALATVPQINGHNPSAVELLDRDVLREAKINASTRDMAGWIKGDPAAVLLTEFFGETATEAAAKAETFAATMLARGLGYAHPVLLEANEQRDAWETRKLGLGLISNVKGPVKGQAFVEDACVPVDVLAQYIGHLQAKCLELGIDWSMYAHASVGVIHFRPAVDLHRPEHREAMRQLTEFAFEQVMRCGGVITGEHGDGFVRGGFIPRTYGPAVYEAFKQIKTLFDPHHLMNPGKIIDSPSMTDADLLRYGSHYRVAEVPSLFHYRDQAPPELQHSGFRLAVEQCNGVGACRKLGSGTMCPSYMATRDEKDTTRGRANALRLAMSGQLGDEQDITKALGGDEVHGVLELCLSCKACKSECPNAVDMSRLKADALQMRHDHRGLPLGYKLIGRLPDVARFQRGLVATLSNTLAKLPPYRWLFEKLTGIDHRRPLPPFATRHLAGLLKQRKSSHADHSSASVQAANEPSHSTRRTVVLFNDTYTNTMEPRVGLAAIDLLEGCGYDVLLADAGCCQRPRLSKGMVREAKTLGRRTMQNLDRFVRQGYPILCLEPSCASALRDDLPDLIDDVELGQRVAAHIHMIDVFLEAEGVTLRSRHRELLLHGHCHQKALFGTDAIRRLFAAMPDVHCTEVDAGCCGMAGSFGYEHYELSRAIGEDRLFPAVRSAVRQGQTVVACGISCRHQLHDFLNVKAKHWVEVVEPAP
ncbi:MAG: FAD-linked oxidase C-terminal domain-containing protein [Phycisphaeraceae bacterium]